MISKYIEKYLERTESPYFSLYFFIISLSFMVALIFSIILGDDDDVFYNTLDVISSISSLSAFIVAFSAYRYATTQFRKDSKDKIIIELSKELKLNLKRNIQSSLDKYPLVINSLKYCDNESLLNINLSIFQDIESSLTGFDFKFKESLHSLELVDADCATKIKSELVTFIDFINEVRKFNSFCLYITEGTIFIVKKNPDCLKKQTELSYKAIIKEDFYEKRFNTKKGFDLNNELDFIIDSIQLSLDKL